MPGRVVGVADAVVVDLVGREARAGYQEREGGGAGERGLGSGQRGALGRGLSWRCGPSMLMQEALRGLAGRLADQLSALNWALGLGPDGPPDSRDGAAAPGQDSSAGAAAMGTGNAHR